MTSSVPRKKSAVTGMGPPMQLELTLLFPPTCGKLDPQGACLKEGGRK